MSNNHIGRDIYCEIEYQPKENNEEKLEYLVEFSLKTILVIVLLFIKIKNMN